MMKIYFGILPVVGFIILPVAFLRYAFYTWQFVQVEEQASTEWKEGLDTIAAHKLSDEIAPGTLNSIFKQAQIKK